MCTQLDAPFSENASWTLPGANVAPPRSCAGRPVTTSAGELFAGHHAASPASAGAQGGGVATVTGCDAELLPETGSLGLGATLAGFGCAAAQGAVSSS